MLQSTSNTPPAGTFTATTNEASAEASARAVLRNQLHGIKNRLHLARFDMKTQTYSELEISLQALLSLVDRPEASAETVARYWGIYVENINLDSLSLEARALSVELLELGKEIYEALEIKQAEGLADFAN